MAVAAATSAARTRQLRHCNHQHNREGHYRLHAVMQIEGVLATKSAESGRYKRGLHRENWHLMKFQSGFSSSN